MSRSGDAGLALLRERRAALPALIRGAAGCEDPELGVAAARVRRFLVTGIGSSAGHARFLASVLAEELQLPARFVPTSAVARDPGGDDAVLLVFSQGLSPNACTALARAGRWARAVLVSGVQPGDGERGERLARVCAAGVRLVSLPEALAAESGTLLRVAGPLVGYVVALAVARSLARELGQMPEALVFPVDRVCEALAAAPDRAARAFPESPLPFAPGVRLGLLASGGYAERATNLGTKIQEGLLLPAPPCWDLLEFAHGPFQELYDGEAWWVALARSDAAHEPELLARLRAMLPARHRLRELRAELPGPLAIFEHEAQWNELVLRGIEERGIAAAEWPGRGRDAPLYDVGSELAAAGPQAAEGRAQRGAAERSSASSLEASTSPEVAAALAAGRTTAVLALGSTEQHGSHLPLATDTWVAEALAARFCQQVPEAQRCPALPLGIAPEHLAFAGTLSLAAATLEAILGDLLNSLARHGFHHAFVFSAHGGNAAALREMLPRLDAREPSLQVLGFTDHAAVTAACHAAAARFGVAPEAAGHHAGEFETSIVAGLRGGALRAPLEPGHCDPVADPQQLFTPDLSSHAPSGVVGDPRGADPARAQVYLDAWAGLLVSGYRAAKKRHQTKGTVNP